MVEIDAYSITETARRLAVSGRHIHRLVKSGELPSILIGRRRLVRRETLDRWLKGLETKSDTSNAA
jgi:excisionase family DNA binding protein